MSDAMRVIHKYQLSLSLQVLKIGRNPKILKMMVQDRVPTVWIEHDVGEKDVVKRFYVMTTGQEFDSDAEEIYVDSFQIGAFVGHIYYK